jgi:hypothetical protein
MNLNGEFVRHSVFGRGQIVDIDAGQMSVLFCETNEKKKFVYPSAIDTFIRLEDAEKAKEFKKQADAAAHYEAIAKKEEAERQAIEKNALLEQAKQRKKTAKKKTTRTSKTKTEGPVV